MNKELTAAAIIWETAGKELRRRRDEVFPVGSAVIVKDTAHGIVAAQGECPPNLVPVRFENGNVWWKHVNECQPIPWKQAHPAVRRMKLRMSGIQLGIAPK